MPAVAEHQPGDQRGGGKGVHGGRIETRQPVGEADVFRLALLGGQHQAHQFAKESIGPGGGHAYGEGRREVDLARMHDHAGAGGLGRGFAGEERAVHVAHAVDHFAIGGELVAGCDGDRLSGAEVAGRHEAPLAVIADHRCALGGERYELGHGGAGAGPHQVIEIAAGEQEEQQRDRGVEIGVLGMIDGLEQAHGGGKDNAHRDRHIHVDAAQAERVGGGLEERPACVGDGGKGYHRRKPVEEIARGIGSAGPYRDRQQHHIGGGETGDGEGAQQHALFVIVLGHPGLARVEGPRAIAQFQQVVDQRLRLKAAVLPGDRYPPASEVDTNAGNARNRHQAGFDLRNGVRRSDLRRHKFDAFQARPRIAHPALGVFARQQERLHAVIVEIAAGESHLIFFSLREKKGPTPKAWEDEGHPRPA